MPGPAANRLRVLLVEDSPLLAARLGEMIGQLPDIELLGVADTEAGAVAEVRRDKPDVLVLDLWLKQGTGFGVMRAECGHDCRPTTVILTNFALPEYRREAEALGAAWFLDKARDFDRLPQLLQDLLAEKRRRDP